VLRSLNEVRILEPRLLIQSRLFLFLSGGKTGRLHMSGIILALYSVVVFVLDTKSFVLYQLVVGFIYDLEKLR